LADDGFGQFVDLHFLLPGAFLAQGLQLGFAGGGLVVAEPLLGLLLGLALGLVLDAAAVLFLALARLFGEALGFGLLRGIVLREARGEAVFQRELGGQPHYGKVTLTVVPLARERGRDIHVPPDAKVWPKAWLEAVAEGLEDGLNAGALQGYPVQDVGVRVEELGRMECQSSAVGYRMAAAQALKNALREAGPVLLEPVMFLEIGVPDDFVGDVIGLLGSKGAKIENLFDRGGQKVVQALAPLRALFGFSTDLRSATQGRAGMVMRFERFDVLE